MAVKRREIAKIACRPLTPARWDDLARLFGPNGACSGCWCMFFRQTSGAYNQAHGEPNRRAFKRVVDSGRPVGVIAYADGEPAGWCAVAPRDDYPRVQRSRILEPVDERSAWAVTCFFVKTGYRGLGLNTTLLAAAVEYARKRGAKLIEGYPIDPRRKITNMEGYHGLVSTFRAAGFHEVARRSPIRPIMRLETAKTSAAAGRRGARDEVRPLAGTPRGARPPGTRPRPARRASRRTSHARG